MFLHNKFKLKKLTLLCANLSHKGKHWIIFATLIAK
jgi:hypothetical protein